MFPRARWRCLECTLKSYSANAKTLAQLPIAPHPSSFVHNRNFSTSPRKYSKIGKAPLSIPPGVSFEVLPPVIGKRKRDAVDQQKEMATVHIKGPLGEMSMPIPPFITISREAPDAPPVLSIQNPEEKFQKAMWGM
jgi:large subunit ribosomal protein L6